MLFKRYSSNLVLIQSKIQNFVLNQMNLTTGLEWLVNRINILISEQNTLKTRMDVFDSNIESKTNEFIQENNLTNIEIEYISGSVNQYKISRILDDLSFISDEAKLEFIIDHNFGVEPNLMIYTKTNINDPFEYTLTGFINNENQTIITFTEPVFVKVIYKI